MDSRIRTLGRIWPGNLSVETGFTCDKTAEGLSDSIECTLHPASAYPLNLDSIERKHQISIRRFRDAFAMCRNWSNARVEVRRFPVGGVTFFLSNTNTNTDVRFFSDLDAERLIDVTKGDRDSRIYTFRRSTCSLEANKHAMIESGGFCLTINDQFLILSAMNEFGTWTNIALSGWECNS